jgi:hypothetical protein
MATVPPPPNPVTFTNLMHTAVDAIFSSAGDGGSPTIQSQITYGTSPTTGMVTVDADPVTHISGLAQKTRYFFWARNRNAIGWSDWSTRSDITTRSVPDAPHPVALSFQTQDTVVAQFTDNYLGGVPALEHQMAYGKNPTTPELFVSSNDTTIENLDPGQVYYFWARVRNAYGWGPYSPRTQVTLRAGALVNQGGVWKRAVPYVNDGGVWKLAKPWVKQAGVWKEVL